MTKPTSAEADAINRRRGKWSVVGIPHKGWTCVDVEDLGEPSETCEMCESAEIRYVHVMTHPDYGFPAGDDPMRCGCVCAGHMEGDVEAARSRERSAKGRFQRRANFMHSQRWRGTLKGNERLKTRGCYVVIAPNGKHFRPLIYSQGALVWTGSYELSSDQAKLKAFDALERIAG